MVKGILAGNVPLIQVTVAWGNAIQNEHFILDTGFTGDLQVTEKMATDLGLQVTGVTPVRIANGQVINTGTALAVTAMENATNLVSVLISAGSPLAGIGFLKKYGYKATVCGKYLTVELDKDH